MTAGPPIGSPEPVSTSHQLDGFDCGTPSLDEWLKRRARINEIEGGSRTYVAAAGDQVAGYYAIATGSVLRNAVPSRIARNMPDPIPLILIGRLAVDCKWQGNGLGRSLLIDALTRCHAAGEIVGVRAIMVHAISAAAQTFYEHYGFVEAPGIPRTLLLEMKNVKRLAG